MPRPRDDLLPQMPHPREDKVVQCSTNAREGVGGGGDISAVGIDGAIIASLIYRRESLLIPEQNHFNSLL